MGSFFDSDLVLGDYLAVLRDAEVETLAAVHFGRDEFPVGRRIFRGISSRSVALPVRLLVTDALNLGTHTLILAHSHPSGDARPSQADIESTDVLARLLTMLSVTLVDHLIVTRNETYSFKANGLIRNGVFSPRLVMHSASAVLITAER